jgi:hypothetical protein
MTVEALFGRKSPLLCAAVNGSIAEMLTALAENMNSTGERGPRRPTQAGGPSLAPELAPERKRAGVSGGELHAKIRR